MPFSSKCNQLFIKIDNNDTEPSDFRDYAERILDENPKIIEEIDPLMGQSPLLYAIISMHQKRQMIGNGNSENGMQKNWAEDNLKILACLMLERGANPNSSWRGVVRQTAADSFIRFLELHLKLSQQLINVDPQILLAKYTALMRLFIKQKAIFDLSQCTSGPVKVILSAFINKAKQDIAQAQVSDTLVPRLHP